MRAALDAAALPIQDWHEAAALLLAKAQRATDAKAKAAVRDQVRRISAGIGEARTTLIREFMDQPPALAGHSRVIDLEKSLDQLEGMLGQVDQALSER